MAKAKSQHVNLSTEPADIVATMQAEIKAVRYQKRKAYGGTRKYELWKLEQKEHALEKKQSQQSGLTEWISPVGNRWIMYSLADYLPKVNRVLTSHLAFIYYETYASCGAFFPLFPEGGRTPNGVIIFTSHFFQRLSERAGIPFRSKQMIQEFISTNFMRHVTSKDKLGGEAIMRFRCGYGIGVVRSVEPYVVEVRTFLTDEQLSPSQRKRMQYADMDARIIDGVGDAAGKATFDYLERIGYYFCKLAQAWNGFNPKDYTSREIMLMVVESLPSTFFDCLVVDNKQPSFQIAATLAKSTVDVLIRMAETQGYEGWTQESVMNGLVSGFDVNQNQ